MLLRHAMRTQGREKIVGTDKLSKGKGSHVYRVQRQQMERNATNPDQLQKSPGKKRQKGNRKVLCVCVCVDNSDNYVSETQPRISVCMRRKSQLSPHCYQYP